MGVRTTELCEYLDVKEEVIVTVLSKGEHLERLKTGKKPRYKFHNLNPYLCAVRFYRYFIYKLSLIDRTWTN